MKRLLNEGVAIANAYARANTVFPRDPDQRIYDAESEWVMALPVWIQSISRFTVQKSTSCICRQISQLRITGLSPSTGQNSGKKPYLIFRFYGPEEEFYNKTFKLADVELVK